MTKNSSETRRTRVTTQTPDFTDPDVGLVVSSEWVLGTPERLNAAADAVMRSWRDDEWPAGIQSYTLLLGSDGSTMRHYSQWDGVQAFAQYTEQLRDARVAPVDVQFPEIVRRGMQHYRVYRTFEAPEPMPKPETIVVALGTFPEPGDAHRFVDDMLDSPTPENEPTGSSGLASAHFHVSLDGTEILNYAQWTNDAAYRDAMGLGPDDPLPTGVQQFTVHSTMLPAPADA